MKFDRNRMTERTRHRRRTDLADAIENVTLLATPSLWPTHSSFNVGRGQRPQAFCAHDLRRVDRIAHGMRMEPADPARCPEFEARADPLICGVAFATLLAP